MRRMILLFYSSIGYSKADFHNGESTAHKTIDTRAGCHRDNTLIGYCFPVSFIRAIFKCRWRLTSFLCWVGHVASCVGSDSFSHGGDQLHNVWSAAPQDYPNDWGCEITRDHAAPTPGPVSPRNKERVCHVIVTEINWTTVMASTITPLPKY